jgi:hypothetical protein
LHSSLFPQCQATHGATGAMRGTGATASVIIMGSGGLVIGPGCCWGPYWWDYPPPYYAYAPAPVIVQEPPVYVEPPAPPQSYWVLLSHYFRTAATRSTPLVPFCVRTAFG